MKIIEQLPQLAPAAGELPPTERAIGLIVLATDYTIEHEWRLIFQSIGGVALYHTRIHNDDCVTPDTLRAMAPRITECAATLTPATPLDVIAYGCTSASVLIGDAAVTAAIHQAKPTAQCTTPSAAAVAALRALNTTRIGLITPYTTAINQDLAAYFTAQGFTVTALATFNEPHDSRVAHISTAAIRNAIITLLTATPVEALFISCTSIRGLHAIATLEAEFHLPLLTSNQVLAWHALRLATHPISLPQFGTLFTLP